MHTKVGPAIAGACAGIVNGLFGAGGGMVLVPLLQLLAKYDQRQIFSQSILIILPICLVSLHSAASSAPLPWKESVPYLIGSAAGGYLSVRFGHRIPVKWLHRLLGVLILWAGVRYLC